MFWKDGVRARRTREHAPKPRMLARGRMRGNDAEANRPEDEKVNVWEEQRLKGGTPRQT